MVILYKTTPELRKPNLDGSQWCPQYRGSTVYTIISNVQLLFNHSVISCHQISRLTSQSLVWPHLTWGTKMGLCLDSTPPYPSLVSVTHVLYIHTLLLCVFIEHSTSVEDIERFAIELKSKLVSPCYSTLYTMYRIGHYFRGLHISRISRLLPYSRN